MMTPVGFETLFGTLPLAVELPAAGTLLGVGPEQYESAEGAAQAIETAHVLGLDIFAVRDVMHSADFTRTLDAYIAEAHENNWVGAGVMQSQLARMVRRDKNWKSKIEDLKEAPNHQWAFNGGIFATQPFPLNKPVRGDVYSDPALIPLGIQSRYARTTDIQPEYFEDSVRQEQMDVRRIRPLHHLSEGRAADLIAEKYQRMSKKLMRWKKKYPNDWEQRRDEILSDITRGDKYSAKDQIKVGEYFTEGEDRPKYLLLNGHRRTATLCLMAANKKIPLDWLLHLPVEVYPVKKEKETISRMTAGRHLSLEQVLADITISGVSPKMAVARLNESHFVDSALANPLSLVHLDDLLDISVQELMILATSNPKDPLYRGIVKYLKGNRIIEEEAIDIIVQVVAVASPQLQTYIIQEAAGDPIKLAFFVDSFISSQREGSEELLFNLAKKGMSIEFLRRLKRGRVSFDIVVFEESVHKGKNCFYKANDRLSRSGSFEKDVSGEVSNEKDCPVCGFLLQIEDFCKNADTEGLTFIMSELKNFPFLTIFRSLLNMFRNEASKTMRDQLGGSLRKVLNEIKNSSRWDQFINSDCWTPDDIKDMLKMLTY